MHSKGNNPTKGKTPKSKAREFHSLFDDVDDFYIREPEEDEVNRKEKIFTKKQLKIVKRYFNSFKDSIFTANHRYQKQELEKIFDVIYHYFLSNCEGKLLNEKLFYDGYKSRTDISDETKKIFEEKIENELENYIRVQFFYANLVLLFLGDDTKDIEGIVKTVNAQLKREENRKRSKEKLEAFVKVMELFLSDRNLTEYAACKQIYNQNESLSTDSEAFKSNFRDFVASDKYIETYPIIITYRKENENRKKKKSQ